MTGLDIDGRGQGNGFVSGTFAAIAFLDADGLYVDGTISGMRDSALSGAQHGYGVLARSTAGASHSVAFVDATLLDGGDRDDIIQAGGGRDIIRFSADLNTGNGGAGQDTLLLAGTAADYAILVLGLDHFRITHHADGAVTAATSIETLGFIPAEPLVANDDTFAVIAGDLHVLDILGNDTGTGMIIGAGLTAGDGTLSVTGAGDALELDLTAA